MFFIRLVLGLVLSFCFSVSLSAETQKQSFFGDLQELQEQVIAKRLKLFNPETCAQESANILTNLYNFNPNHYKISDIYSSGRSAIEKIWQIRSMLRKSAAGDCIKEIQKIFYALRNLEDFIGYHVFFEASTHTLEEPLQSPHVLPETLSINSGDFLLTWKDGFFLAPKLVAIHDVQPIQKYLESGTIRAVLFRPINAEAAKRASPTDIEVNSEFTLEGEWRDYSRLREFWLKEVVSSKMHEWMEKEGYVLRSTIKSRLLRSFLYIARRRELCVSFLKDSVPPNLSRSELEVALITNEVAGYLYRKLDEADRGHREETEFSMTRKELDNTLEFFREEDLEYWKTSLIPFQNMFWSFRP